MYWDTMRPFVWGVCLFRSRREKTLTAAKRQSTVAPPVCIKIDENNTEQYGVPVKPTWIGRSFFVRSIHRVLYWNFLIFTESIFLLVQFSPGNSYFGVPLHGQIDCSVLFICPLFSRLEWVWGNLILWMLSRFQQFLPSSYYANNIFSVFVFINLLSFLIQIWRYFQSVYLKLTFNAINIPGSSSNLFY